MSGYKLKPKNSIIIGSPISGINYHVIKFYMVLPEKNDNGPKEMYYEASEKHKVGDCKHCDVLELKEDN